MEHTHFDLFGIDLSEHVKQHVRVHFFCNETAHTKKGIQILRDLEKKNILDTGFDPTINTKILIHGFDSSILSESMQIVKNAYFEVGNQNVIVVDWSDLDPFPLYIAGLYYVEGVAKRVAEIIDFMGNEKILALDKLHMVGHSLGAHVAAMAAENINTGRVARITGLDPARPFVNMNKVDGRLSKDDADLVDVIHTNAGTLAVQQACGHLDFYVNGGKRQPGCNFDLTGGCSHCRSYELFAESIVNPTAFPESYDCYSEWDALKNRCSVDEETVYATMGEHISYEYEGVYALETNAKKPFSKKK